jgi:DNA-binding MltR family transcriptional regulator
MIWLEDEFSKKVADIAEFHKIFSKETDRGCTLLAASLIDLELTELLKQTFVQNEKILKKIFSPNGPLGTLSSKIDIWYCLGNCSKVIYNKMHVIRDIRNEFGHSFKALSFDDKIISQKIKSIALSSHTIKTNRIIFIDVLNSILMDIYLNGSMTHLPSEPQYIEVNSSGLKAIINSHKKRVNKPRR